MKQRVSYTSKGFDEINYHHISVRDNVKKRQNNWFLRYI